MSKAKTTEPTFNVADNNINKVDADTSIWRIFKTIFASTANIAVSTCGAGEEVMDGAHKVAHATNIRADIIITEAQHDRAKALELLNA